MIMRQPAPVSAETERESIPAGTAEPEASGSDPSGQKASEPETSEPGTSESETSERETSEPETSERETSESETSESETSGDAGSGTIWNITISDIAPVIPDGGRVYDGTDRISVRFRWDLRPEAATAPSDNSPVPMVNVTCSSHLASPHAGIETVIYDFHVQTDDPEHVFMAADNPHPDLTVDVQKRMLTVVIPDGKKVFAAKADMDYIWPDESTEIDMNREKPGAGEGKVPEDFALEAQISGFLADKSGSPLIPEGFQAPEITVDSKVLKADSPMFRYDEDPEAGKGGQKTGSGKEAVYERALIMKRKKDGTLTGNATSDYVFCEDPADPHYHCGSVRIVSSRVSEGEDYAIEGSSLIRENGKLIIRTGTGFSVKVKKQSPYNTGAVMDTVVSDGKFSFRLKKTDRRGQVLAESMPEELSYLADGQVPAVSAAVSGGHQEQGILFSDSDFLADISPVPDPVSGMAQVRYRIRKGYRLPSGADVLPVSGPWNQASLSDLTQVRITEEGVYQIEVMVSDRVGNTAAALSRIFVIDRTKPELHIYGAADNSANSGEVKLVFSCSDPFYRKGSSRYEVTSAFGGIVPPELSGSESNEGIVIRLADFEHTRAADAWYHVTFRAEDMAGNASSAETDFSVNRFGSSYGISGGTSKQLSLYYHRKPFDVTYLETNIDRVNSPKVLVMRNGRKLSHVPVLSEETGGSGEDGLHHYRYTIAGDTFRKDGDYEVILMTSDLAGNSGDTGERNLPVHFAIDAQKPECLVSGLEEKGVYRTQSLTAVFEVRDNLAPESAEVYKDARLWKSYSAAMIRKAGGVFKVALHQSPAWQRLQFHVTDKAGNEYWTDEYYAFLSEEGEAPDGQKFGESAEKLAEKKRERKKDAGGDDRKDRGGGEESSTESDREGPDTHGTGEKTDKRDVKTGHKSAADLLAETGTETAGKDSGEKRSRHPAFYGFFPAVTFSCLYAVIWFLRHTGNRKTGSSE